MVIMVRTMMLMVLRLLMMSFMSVKQFGQNCSVVADML